MPIRLAAALTIVLTGTAFAQDWPTGPVHVYVGFPAGSSPDLLARIVTEPLAQKLGQPVVIENKPGAGGVIGVQQMLAAKRDGHSFGTTINGPLTTSPRLVPDIGYDVAKDIAPVALIATSPLVLAVGKDGPAGVRAGGVNRDERGFGLVGGGLVPPRCDGLVAAAASI